MGTESHGPGTHSVMLVLNKMEHLERQSIFAPFRIRQNECRVAGLGSMQQ